MIPDREEDIRPRFHKSRSARHAADVSVDNVPNENGGVEEDEDDCLDDDSSLSDWNLSQYSGFILNKLHFTRLFTFCSSCLQENVVLLR